MNCCKKLLEMFDYKIDLQLKRKAAWNENAQRFFIARKGYQNTVRDGIALLLIKELRSRPWRSTVSMATRAWWTHCHGNEWAKDALLGKFD